MVAIPEGMMAIDVDDDDGGRAAAARLADELGRAAPDPVASAPRTVST